MKKNKNKNTMKLYNFDNDKSEVEAKVCFQYNKAKKLVSNVNIHEFQGIKYDLLKIYANEFKHYFQTVEIFDNKFRRITTITTQSTTVVWDIKTRIEQEIQPTCIPFVFIKWTHSHEEIIPSPSPPFLHSPSCVRRKNVCKIRYNSDWDIYCTIVNGNTYEIEIEYTGTTTPDLTQINTLITNLFKDRFESKIIKQLNYMVCGRQVPYLNWCVNKPINLKFDMWSSMINTYGFFLKMDGIRYLLFSFKNKLYAINESLRIQVFEDTRVPHGTILDAELVNDTFHVFDILFYNGNDIRNKDMHFRSIILKQVPYDLNMEYTELETDFNIIMHYIVSGFPDYTDGIIFCPLNEVYKNKVTFKYKPTHLLTIDFLIKSDALYAVDSNGDYIAFKGTDMYPYKFKLDESYIIDSITEFQYKDDKFIPLKIRHDKIKPNYIEVALDIWEDVNNPIDLSSFLENISSCIN